MQPSERWIHNDAEGQWELSHPKGERPYCIVTDSAVEHSKDLFWLEERLGNPDHWHHVSYSTDIYGGHVRIPQCPACKAFTVDGREHKEWHLALGK